MDGPTNSTHPENVRGCSVRPSRTGDTATAGNAAAVTGARV